MSLSIYKEPDSIVFSGNPIIYGVKDSNVLSETTEQPSIASIKFNSAINNSPLYQITITYGNYSKMLEFGIDLPYTGTYNMSQWAIACMNAMNDIYELESRFYIVNYLDTVYLAEKEVQNDISITKYNIYAQLTLTTEQTSQSFDNENLHSIIITPTKTELLSLPGGAPDRTVYVPFGGGKEIETLPTVTVDNGINGRTGDGSRYIDTTINDLVREKKTGHFDLEQLYVIYNDIGSVFKMQFNSKTIDTINESIYSNSIIVIDAKISEVMQAEINEMDISLWQYIQNMKMPLTWSPAKKSIDIYNPEILYYMTEVEVNINIKVKEYFTNGTDSTKTLATFDLFSGIVLFSASFLNIRTANPVAPLSKYEIWIENGDTSILMDKRTYIMDYNYVKNPRWWLFKNSFGVYDTIRTTGKAVKSRENTKEFVEKDLPDKYTHLDRDIEQVNVSGNFVLECSSGPVSKEMAKYFVEFLESEDIYLLSEGKALPAIIYEGNFPIDSDILNLENIQFKAEANNLETEDVDLNDTLPISGDFNGDFNEGYL